MDVLTKILLVLSLPVLLFARGLNALCGRDPLRLREPPADTCWIERAVQPSTASYFSERSVAEGRNQGGFGWIAAGLLKALARMSTPRRHLAEGEKFSAGADREQGIPDEIYTLW